MQKQFQSLGLTWVLFFCGANPSAYAEQASDLRNPEFLWEISKNHLKDPLQWPSIWKQVREDNASENSASGKNQYGNADLEAFTPSNFHQKVTPKNSDWTLNEEKRTQRYLQKMRPLQAQLYQTLSPEENLGHASSQRQNGPRRYFLSQSLVLNTPFMAESKAGEGFFPQETRLKYSAANESEILQLYDEVTIFRGHESGVKVGDFYRTYSIRERYRSIAAGRNLGALVETNGIIQITRVGSKSSVGKLVQCFGTISSKSRACPLTQAPEVFATGYSPVMDGKQTAQVVLVTQEHQFPQPFTFAIVDRGSMKGQRVGDMVLFYNRNAGRMSDKVLGNGLVVQVQEQSSTVLIKDLYPGFINRGDYTVTVQTPIL